MLLVTLICQLGKEGNLLLGREWFIKYDYENLKLTINLHRRIILW